MTMNRFNELATTWTMRLGAAVALATAVAVTSSGCFDRDDDDVVPGAPLDERVEERGTVYDPPNGVERAAERIDEGAERVDESAERAADRVDESVEPEADEGLDPQIDEHFDGRFGR